MSPPDSLSIQPDDSTPAVGRPWGKWLWLLLLGALVTKSIVESDQHTTFPGFVRGSELFLADKDPYISSFWEYRYSPAFATTFSIFTAVPTRLGGAIWNLATIGVLWWGIQQLLKYVLPQRWGADRREVFYGLVLLVALRGLWASQTTPIVIALVCGAAAAIVRERWWRAAYLLAIPVFIKVWPLALALLFLSGRPRQLILRFGLALASLALIPLAIKSPTVVWWQYQNWMQALFGPMQVRHIYRDLWALWEAVYPPVSSKGYLVLQLGSALAVLGLCLWQRFRAPTVGHWCTFVLSMWSGWQLCIGPGVERNTFCLAAPLLAWGLMSSRETRIGHGMMLASVSLIVIFSFGVCERELVQYVPAVLGALPIGALIYAVWAVQHARDWTSAESALKRSQSAADTSVTLRGAA
jgi:hypothetical protein